MLFFDSRDRSASPQARARIRWLVDLGARPIAECRGDEAGYLFAGDRGLEDYRRLVSGKMGITDGPEQRAALSDLGRVLGRLDVPTPRTWRIELDDPLPGDLRYPVFVRTVRTSWKLGGSAGKVRCRAALEDECQELRRAFGWDAPVLAREWIRFAPAGRWRRGIVPREIRVWIVDGRPLAWSFHHLHVIPEPNGFPPRKEDLLLLRNHAASIGAAFDARLIVADFAPDREGRWWLIEADCGSAAGTAHEQVYRRVALALDGAPVDAYEDAVGGTFKEDP